MHSQTLSLPYIEIFLTVMKQDIRLQNINSYAFFILNLGPGQEIHHNASSLSCVTHTNIPTCAVIHPFSCFSKCTHMPKPVRTDHSTHIYTHTHTLMQHFFSGYSQTDGEVHSYISKLCATIQTSTDRALKAMARLNIILYSTKMLSGNTLPWLISAADLEPSDKYVSACVEMRNF